MDRRTDEHGGVGVGGGAYKNKMKPKIMLQQCEGMSQYEMVEICVELKIRDSVVLYMCCATKIQ